MDRNKIEEARMEHEAHKKAMDMLFSMLEAIAPEDMKPMTQLPKLCQNIDDKTGLILRLVADTPGLDASIKLASEANELLFRVNEALEAFIEQHTEGGTFE